MSLVFVSPDDAIVREFISKSGGDKRRNLDYFGQSSGREGPEGFLVWVQNRTLGAHFHDVDQFQILLGDEGSLFQRTEVPFAMVHYADAYSTYGPLIGAEQPLRFFTLRAEPTEFIGYMPADREKLRHRGQRQRHSELDETGPGVDDVVEEVLFEDEDGLLATAIRASAGSTFSTPPLLDSRGQFLYVVSGEVEWDGKTFGPESLGWQSAGEEGRGLRCTADCQVVTMRFPVKATNPRFED